MQDERIVALQSELDEIEAMTRKKTLDDIDQDFDKEENAISEKRKKKRQSEDDAESISYLKKGDVEDVEEEDDRMEDKEYDDKVVDADGDYDKEDEAMDDMMYKGKAPPKKKKKRK